MELSEFDFVIAYLSGELNAVPDALSRVYCAAMRENTLYIIHASLCHPGITRLNHFVRANNLPYSVDDVRSLRYSECLPIYTLIGARPLCHMTSFRTCTIRHRLQQHFYL